MQVFEFIPFESQEPESHAGVVIELRMANPRYAEELAGYQEALKLNPFAEKNVFETFCVGLVDSPSALIGADEVCTPITELTLVVGYPFQGQYAVPIRTAAKDGFTRGELFRQIVAVHSTMYERATVSSHERLYNAKVESPEFGSAFHALEDLVLEEVKLEARSDGRVFAWVFLGS